MSDILGVVGIVYNYLDTIVNHNYLSQDYCDLKMYYCPMPVCYYYLTSNCTVVDLQLHV